MDNILEMLSISVSGGVFSLLLYENSKSVYGQDGFLLGKIDFKETKKLTDADHSVINKETIIKIKSIIPCPHQFHFYDSSGKINEDKIRNFLGHKETDVIGWYIYRPTRYGMKMLLREKVVHKQLAKFFQQPEHQFSCCVLIADWSHNRATHSLSQTFIRYNRGSYDGIPLRIINLSDPMCMFKNGENTSDVVNNIIKNVKPSNATRGHLLVKNVQGVLQQKIKELVLKVVDKEQILFELENEVKKLELALKYKDGCVIEVDHTIENGLIDHSFDSKGTK